MKNNMYNQFTKSDMPLDNSLNLPAGGTINSANQTAKKPRISAIGAKATSKTTSTSSKPRSKSTTATTSTAAKTTATRTRSATSTVKTATTSKTTAAGRLTTAKKSTSAQKPEIKTEEKQETKKSLRGKLSKNDITAKSLEKLNEENLKNSYRNKRNQSVIMWLAILLTISTTFLAVFFIVIRVEKTCYVYKHGDVDVSVLINGEEMSEFAAPSNLTGGCVFNFNVDLVINETGEYNIKLDIKCFYQNNILKSMVVYEPNLEVLTYNNLGYYNTKTTVQGNETIRLCQGIALSETGKNVKIDEFRMEINVYVERAS